MVSQPLIAGRVGAVLALLGRDQVEDFEGGLFVGEVAAVAYRRGRQRARDRPV